MVENSQSAPVTRAPFPEGAINTDDKSVADFKKRLLRPDQVSEKFASKEPTKPFLLFVAGPSGSGKSTLVEVLKRKSYFPANTVFLDSDDFFHFIPKSEQDAQVHPEKYAPYADMYYTMREEIVKQAIAEGRPVVIENHMTNLDANRSLIKAAKAAGFETMAIGVHTLPKDYLHLWQHASDEPVPESKTLSAFKVNETFAQHWPQIAGELDYAALYTSHVSRRSEVGYIRNNPGALIELTAEYEGAKDNPVCYVHQQENFNDFRKWQKLNHGATSAETFFAEGKDSDYRDFAGRVERGGRSSETPQTTTSGPISRIASVREFSGTLARSAGG